MVRIKRFGVLSVGIISGILYAIGGLIGALFMIPFVAIMSAIDPMMNGDFTPFGWIFGGFAIILLPIIYGVLGFIGGIICAALYNLFAMLVGGIKVELESPGATE